MKCLVDVFVELEGRVDVYRVEIDGVGDIIGNNVEYRFTGCGIGALKHESNYFWYMLYDDSFKFDNN